jgi:hypothetical protein
VCYDCELRVAIAITTELEYSCLISDDVDVNVAATKRHDTSTCIDRIFVLIHEDNTVQSVEPHLVAAEVVEVQDVGLAGLACNNAHASDIRAGEDVGWEQLEWCCTQIFVGSIQLLLLPWHEEVDHCESAIVVDLSIDCRFFESRGRLSTRYRRIRQLRGVAIAGGEEETASSIV